MLEWARHYEMELTARRRRSFCHSILSCTDGHITEKRKSPVVYEARKREKAALGKMMKTRSAFRLTIIRAESLPDICNPSAKALRLERSCFRPRGNFFNDESDLSFYAFTTITGGIFVFADNAAQIKTLSLSPFGAPILPFSSKIERDKCDSAALQQLQAEFVQRGAASCTA